MNLAYNLKKKLNKHLSLGIMDRFIFLYIPLSGGKIRCYIGKFGLEVCPCINPSCFSVQIFIVQRNILNTLKIGVARHIP